MRITGCVFAISPVHVCLACNIAPGQSLPAEMALIVEQQAAITIYRARPIEHVHADVAGSESDESVGRTIAPGVGCGSGQDDWGTNWKGREEPADQGR